MGRLVSKKCAALTHDGRRQPQMVVFLWVWSGGPLHRRARTVGVADAVLACYLQNGVFAGWDAAVDGRRKALPGALALAHYLWWAAGTFLERRQQSSDLRVVDAQDDEPILGVRTQRDPMSLDGYTQ